MYKDRPQKKDQGNSGITLTFDDISAIYDSALRRSKGHGDVPSRVAVKNNRWLIKNNLYPIARGEVGVSDTVIRDMEIKIHSDYSKEKGEWIQMFGRINLMSMDLYETLKEDKVNLQTVFEDGGISVDLWKEDEEYGTISSFVTVNTTSKHLSEEQFIKEVEKFKTCFLSVVSFIYENSGCFPSNLNLKVLLL